jgi:malonyl-CoA O-methyltransferase
MPDPSPENQRLVDEIAVAATQARLAGLPGAPWLNLEVARRMAERLTLFKVLPQRVVDWGSLLGGGRRLLLDAYPQAAHVAIEPSESLAARSRELLGAPWWAIWRRRRRCVEVRVDSQALVLNAGLVWSNMQLQAEKNPPVLFARWARMLSSDGFIMFSCLGPGTLQGLRAVYAQQGWPAPTIEFVDMHDLGDMLVRAGFADPVMDQETLTVEWDSPQALCDDLRLLGGNVSPLRFRGLRTGRWKASLHRAVESLRGSTGKLTLDFEVIYGHAFKASLTRSVDGETRVPLDDVRRLMPSARASN